MLLLLAGLLALEAPLSEADARGVLDRWLIAQNAGDRARMFAKPMKVAVFDIKVRAGGSSALVSFGQTFAQGTYNDVGAKQIVVVREAGAVKITSESMLGSEVLSTP